MRVSLTTIITTLVLECKVSEKCRFEDLCFERGFSLLSRTQVAPLVAVSEKSHTYVVNIEVDGLKTVLAWV